MRDATINTLVERMKEEYLEMPGLSLTVQQACRLWGVDSRRTRQMLDVLVAQKFLTETDGGTFVRRH